jgi:D-aminopeptidase
MRSGRRNLITDVRGFKVGNISDPFINTGVTVFTSDQPFVAAVDVMGGAPGTRETELLAPENTVSEVDALVLSGGSAFGLDAASGVADWMRAEGRGFVAHGQNVPIVPAAIVFDLANGGNKDWGRNPYADLGGEAYDKARQGFELGTVGAGTGATTANLKGGLGSASVVLGSGITVGALVVVNAIGQVTVGDGPHFWAAPFEMGKEFGGLGPDPLPKFKTLPFELSEQGANTTIAIVATDVALTPAQAKRMAIAAHDGMARAILPSHTPFDGDLIFAASSAVRDDPLGPRDGIEIGNAAAICLSRAIARGVYHASPVKGDALPTWGQFQAGKKG